MIVFVFGFLCVFFRIIAEFLKASSIYHFIVVASNFAGVLAIVFALLLFT